MITSMCLFATGDTLAQLGIEGRRLPWSRGEEGEEKKDEVWDPVRAARLMFCALPADSADGRRVFRVRAARAQLDQPAREGQVCVAVEDARGARRARPGRVGAVYRVP
jgi:hypothetical protein